MSWHITLPPRKPFAVSKLQSQNRFHRVVTPYLIGVVQGGVQWHLIQSGMRCGWCGNQESQSLSAWAPMQPVADTTFQVHAVVAFVMLVGKVWLWHAPSLFELMTTFVIVLDCT